MLGGIADLFEAVLHPLLVVDVSRRNGGHPEDGVHGRADLMAHPGKEIRLRLIRMFRHRQGIL